MRDDSYQMGEEHASLQYKTVTWSSQFKIPVNNPQHGQKSQLKIPLQETEGKHPGWWFQFIPLRWVVD